MGDLIAQNFGTIIVSVLLLAILTLVVVITVKNKKKGKGFCSCGCSGCPMSSECHKQEEEQ